MKKATKLTFIFENPNSPTVFEEALKNILLEKMLATFVYSEKLPAAG